MFFHRKGNFEYIVVGLGNPGSRYENTRHNAGFMAVDVIAKECGVSFNKFKFKSAIADAQFGGKRVLLMKPETLMNLSGEAIYEAISFYKIPAENVIVLFDDINLDVGRTRIRRKGSAGGHNGIKSIISCIGSEDFPRIKIGVGQKPNPEYDLAAWVLGKFPKEQKEDLDKALSNAAKAAELIVKDNIAEAMNKYNS